MGHNIIIDRRKNPKKKSSENRQRFIRRNKEAVLDAVRRKIRKDSIEDLGKDGTDVIIDKKSIEEPTFSNDHRTGDMDVVQPGNKEYAKGDLIPKPNGGAGGRPKAGDSGDGEDDFEFFLNAEEFLEILFEHLKLPHLVKKNLENLDEYKMVPAGLSTTGTPNNVDLMRTMRNSIARRAALKNPKKKELLLLEEQLKSNKLSDEEREEIQEQMEVLRRKIAAVHFIDDIDVRYRVREKEPQPSTSAVIFFVMDVSGSMTQRKKELAKSFFWLFHRFLKTRYEKIEIRWIRHHHEAKEVNENEFFYGRESGGTQVSTAMELMDDIIKRDYGSSDWNVYLAQASDGDNFSSDNDQLNKIMSESILPAIQYGAYIEIAPMDEWSYPGDSDLWETYANLADYNEHFKMCIVQSAKDIYPVFEKLFKGDKNG